ncbi:hypothetical protein IC617_10225 [Neiella sp. HB171785]|uniref:Uncharacterized protein n=2 Tax=Neiella litorisoli TaxID=2771431 RepID=A0A8J6QV13_9GAMM|nr:hypothetical protein [Neiella litorisoli]
MIELLVTLVLLGLIAAVVAPGLESWLKAREAAAVRSGLASELAMLPVKASQFSQPIVIESVAQLSLDNVNLVFHQPVVVLANGYCLGGKAELQFDDRRYPFDVTEPFCEVQYAQP